MQLREFLDAGLFGEIGGQHGVEQLEDQRGDCRIFPERVGDIVLRIGDARLPQIAGIGAQHRHFAAVEICRKDETVETVIVDAAFEGGDEGILQNLAVPGEIDRAAVCRLEDHVVQHHQGLAVLAGDMNVEGAFADDVEAEVFE